MRRNWPKFTKRVRSGFTLIELVVTLTVVTILVAVAVPTYIDYIARSRVRNAAESLVNQLALARAEAMRLHRNVLVTFNSSAGAWCSGGRQTVAVIEGISLARADAPSCDCSTAAGRALCLVNDNVSLVTSTEHSSVSWVSATNNSLQFDRNVGIVADLAGSTIQLRSIPRPTRYGLSVVVSPMGHARVCVPSGFAMFGGFRSCN